MSELVDLKKEKDFDVLKNKGIKIWLIKICFLIKLGY